MIDTAHMDMDTVDNEYDTLRRLYGFGDTCVLCGKPIMPNTMYCLECGEKWGVKDEICGMHRNPTLG